MTSIGSGEDAGLTVFNLSVQFQARHLVPGSVAGDMASAVPSMILHCLFLGAKPGHYHHYDPCCLHIKRLAPRGSRGLRRQPYFFTH